MAGRKTFELKQQHNMNPRQTSAKLREKKMGMHHSSKTLLSLAMATPDYGTERVK